MSFEATQVRRWVEETLAEKKWTPERWCRLADTTPTNLTRFLRNERSIPSARTLSKLAAVAGTSPSLGPQARLNNLVIVAVYASLSDGLEARSPIGTVKVLGQVSSKAFAFHVQSPALIARGVMPGDLAICEPVALAAPREGDTLVYLTETGEDLGLLLDGRLHRFDGGAIVPLTGVNVSGVVVELQRSMRA